MIDYTNLIGPILASGLTLLITQKSKNQERKLNSIAEQYYKVIAPIHKKIFWDDYKNEDLLFCEVNNVLMKNYSIIPRNAAKELLFAADTKDLHLLRLRVQALFTTYQSKLKIDKNFNVYNYLDNRTECDKMNDHDKIALIKNYENKSYRYRIALNILDFITTVILYLNRIIFTAFGVYIILLLINLSMK